MNGELAGRRNSPWAGFRTAYSFPVGIMDCIGTARVWRRARPACGCCVDVRMSQQPFSRQTQAHVHADCQARSCTKSFANLRRRIHPVTPHSKRCLFPLGRPGGYSSHAFLWMTGLGDSCDQGYQQRPAEHLHWYLQSAVNFRHLKIANNSGNVCVRLQTHRAELSSCSRTCF